MPPPVPEKIPCASEQHLKEELATFQENLAIPETEDSWEKLSRAIQRMTALIKGGAYKFPLSLAPSIKSLSRPLLSAMNSERTRLSATVLDLLSSMIARLDRHFEPLLPVFLPSVLKLCSRTNKLYIARARTVLDTLTTYSTLTTMIPYLQCCWDDKSNSLRLAAAESMIDALTKFNPPDLTRYISQVETAIKSTGVDKDPAVRVAGRKMFECYKVLWPERVESFTGPLPPITKRYLEIITRSRTVSVLADTRDPLSVSVPNSQATTRPGLRRSLSMDALNELNAPKVDRRLQVHHQPETKMVPVRRAAKVISKGEAAQPVPAFRAQEEPLPAAPSKGPSLTRAKSVANLRSHAEAAEVAAGVITSQAEAKGARRVVQPVQAPIQAPPPRSGPSRPTPAVVAPVPASKESASTEASTTTSTPAVEIPLSAPIPKGGGERRGQGAQRVAVPPPPPKPQPATTKTEGNEVNSGPSRATRPIEKPKPFKPQSRTGRMEMKSPTEALNRPGLSRDRSVARSDQTSKDSRPTSRAESVRPNSRLQSRKPIIKPVSKKPVPPQPAPKEQKEEKEPTVTRPAPVRRGLTAPTRAQLERAKVLEDERGKAKPISTRGVNLPKRGFIPVRGRGGTRNVGSRTVSKAPAKAESIPEAGVPLPSSPKVGAVDQETVEEAKDRESPPELVLPHPQGVNVKVESKQDTVPASQTTEEPKLLVNIECPESAPSAEESPEVVQPAQPQTESKAQAQPMSEMDRLLFASPMKPIVFDPPHASSPFTQDGVHPVEKSQTSTAEPPQEERLPVAPAPQSQSPSTPSAPHDPYASLPFFLKEALAAPLPTTPNVRPSPFIRFETDDTTIAYASHRSEEETEDDATMEKLEFNVNGVDPFGRIIQSPCKRRVPARDALVDLSVNQ